MSTRNPKSGNQPLSETIGSAQQRGRDHGERGHVHRAGTGPWPIGRWVERRANHQRAPGRGRSFVSDGGGLVRRLDDGEAGRAGIGEREGNGAIVVEANDAGDRDERRIETASPGRDDDVARLERVSADLERPQVEVPSPRPWQITGCPPRRIRAGTMLALSETSSTREASAPGVDDSSDQPFGERTGMPTRTPSLLPDREDGEAARAVEGRTDDPSGGDRRAAMLA